MQLFGWNSLLGRKKEHFSVWGEHSPVAANARDHLHVT